MRYYTLLFAVATTLLPPVLQAQQTITDYTANLETNNALVKHNAPKKGSAARNGTIYIQDNELRTAKYNTIYASPPTRNGFVNPGVGTVEARFSHSFHRFFYYCTSEYSRLRCGLPFSGNHHIANSAALCTDAYLQCRKHVFTDMQLLPDNTTRHSNSARFFSFDGYVVYQGDTLFGIVTITKHDVGIEHQSITGGTRSTSYELMDKHLSAITVYKGLKELNLVRVHPSDKRLSRVVHSGKLTMYDHKFSFLTARNISSRLQVVPVAGMPVKTKNTETLITMVNTAYNLDIKKDEWENAKLFTVINRLN